MPLDVCSVRNYAISVFTLYVTDFFRVIQTHSNTGYVEYISRHSRTLRKKITFVYFHIVKKQRNKTKTRKQKTKQKQSKTKQTNKQTNKKTNKQNKQNMPGLYITLLLLQC